MALPQSRGHVISFSRKLVISFTKWKHDSKGCWCGTWILDKKIREIGFRDEQLLRRKRDTSRVPTASARDGVVVIVCDTLLYYALVVSLPEE